MKVFVAGATGVLGRQLVPQFMAKGHEDVGMIRSASKQDMVRSLGARPVVADALDPDAVAQAVASAEPEVIVHQLTALSGESTCATSTAPSRPRTACARRNRPPARRRPSRRRATVRGPELRGLAGCTHRWTGEERGCSVRSGPPEQLRGMLDAIRHLEEAVTRRNGSRAWCSLRRVLRPRDHPQRRPRASHTQPSEAPVPSRRGRRRHLVLIHVDDAAAATAVAVERGKRGIYNVVDDDPAPARDWMPELARALGAKPPRRVPRWLGRLLAGEAAAVMMTEVRGASNEKAKRELAGSRGTRAGGRASCRASAEDDRGGVRRAPPVGVRHRLPDAG